MNRIFFLAILLLSFLYPGLNAQPASANKPQLTVEKIMQDPDRWIGTLPGGATWSYESTAFYF